MCQRIAKRANAEDGLEGHFWQGRYKAVRLLDEQSILACAAYVDLNPIRAALAETLEESQFTSVRRRVQAMQLSSTANPAAPASDRAPDACLSPVQNDELRADLSAQACSSGSRCSDKGFCSLTAADYLQLLDWTSRQIAPGKTGSTPSDAPPILDRLQIEPSAWCKLATHFGSLFGLVAGQPQSVDNYRSRVRGQRFNLPAETRQLLTTQSA